MRLYGDQDSESPGFASPLDRQTTGHLECQSLYVVLIRRTRGLGTLFGGFGCHFNFPLKRD